MPTDGKARASSNRERNRYFYGQVLGADDFAQEQAYHREKARRHNRMLHGFGVVCGLDVRPGPGSAVTIEPGLAIDGLGEEIVVESEVVVDLRTADAEGNSVAPCPPAGKLRSSRAKITRRPGERLYVAIRYAECPERPIPTTDDRGEETVAYSRTRESFAVRLLTRLPPGYPKPPGGRKQPAVDPCKEPSTSPWVILADLVLARGHAIAGVDCATHRRHAARVG